MKILICGFSKTGSKTADEALRQLGFKVADPTLSCFTFGNEWNKIFDGKAIPSDLRRMYNKYDVISGIPVYFYWREFLEAFPDLKLIFFTRDEERWLDSWKHQVDVVNQGVLSFPLSVFSPKAKQWIAFINNCLKKHVDPSYRPTWSEYLSPRKRYLKLEDRLMLNAFRRHNKDILQNAPKDRTLVCSVKDGWTPLCDFLKLDKPNLPFPHINKRGNIWAQRFKSDPKVQGMFYEMYISITLMILLVPALVLLL
ncbi:uncharacterized protein LOC120329407 [Styela clava]